MSETEAARRRRGGDPTGRATMPDEGRAAGRHAGNGLTGDTWRWRRKRRAEQPMVPKAKFTSYYGKPIIKPPVWEARDIAGYFFLGGLAGGSSLLAAGADLTGRTELSRAAKAGAFAAITLSLAALVHDLGRPARFVNMMRVFKVTSPMSVGTWLLGGYAPAVGLAAATALTGRLPRLGAAATAGAALLGPAVAAYTAALVSDTAVPAWHDGYREMPFVFTGSAAMAAGGLGLLAAPAAESGPARNLALLGAAVETAAVERMTRRIGMTAEPYHTGRGGAYLRVSKVLAVLGAAGAALSGTPLVPAGRPRRLAAAVSGAALISASAATRWGVFHAGMASARDPKYTVVPQRQRLSERAAAARPPAGGERVADGRDGQRRVQRCRKNAAAQALDAGRSGQRVSLARHGNVRKELAVEDRIPVEVDVAWDSFRQVVNMTSEELRAWLITEASVAEAAESGALPNEPDPGLPRLGRQVVELLRKRKVELTQRDADVMEQVVDFVLTQEAEGPAGTESDEEWRRSLMTVGHDPMRP
jgi:hypothetical protein